MLRLAIHGSLTSATVILSSRMNTSLAVVEVSLHESQFHSYRVATSTTTWNAAPPPAVPTAAPVAAPPLAALATVPLTATPAATPTALLTSPALSPPLPGSPVRGNPAAQRWHAGTFAGPLQSATGAHAPSSESISVASS